MDNDIVRVPLERQMRPVPAHPQIERVVQKQIGQQGADHSLRLPPELRQTVKTLFTVR
jgi:hypothetical protein